MHRHRRRNLLTAWLYVRVLLWEFRWTLASLAGTVLLGAALYLFAGNISLWTAMYSAWMAMLAQPVSADTWYLKLLCGLYPLLGFVIVGEGVVRFALLVISKEQGEKEWMRVMASTYRDHVVLCGVGHLGYRVLEQLLAAKVPVVVLEKDAGGRFIREAKATGVPVLIRDMTDDQSLVEAGVEHARVIIIATNDDMANIEVALDARRMNTKIRIVMRQYDQRIASKISGGLSIDAAFSASGLAAPIVAAMSLGTKVAATYALDGVEYVTAEVKVDGGSTLAGRTLAEIERGHAARVLARTVKGSGCQSPPPPDAVVVSGDVLLVHTAASRLSALAAAGKLKRDA